MARLLPGLLAMLLLCGGPVAAAEVQSGASAESLAAMRALDQRVAVIGHRLAVANLDWCAQRAWLPGFVLHDLSQYGAEYRPAAIRAFGLDAGPGVLALVPAGPADRAGLRTDDILLTFDGQPVPRGTPDRNSSFAQMERILGALDLAFSDGRAALTVRRGGTQLSIEVAAVPGCATRFQLVPGGRMNAQADGIYVQVTTALAQYASEDGELAAVLAHEFAHNVLGHRVRLNQAGVRRGLLANFGMNARRIRETEVEADRLSVWLMVRAGYDPEAASRFWGRFGRRGFNFLGSPTHPNWRLRVQSFEAEIAKLRAAQAAGRPLMPDFTILPRRAGRAG